MTRRIRITHFSMRMNGKSLSDVDGDTGDSILGVDVAGSGGTGCSHSIRAKTVGGLRDWAH